MFEINFLNATLYAFIFLSVFYVTVCVCLRRIITFELKRLFFYITIFSLFGVVGEVFVNTLYLHFFDTPLWEYRLLPTHEGSISYFFIFVWGMLGFYKYITDTVFEHTKRYTETHAGLVMGAESILLELMYNGLYYLTFGNYIFYYFPENLGPFSHLSCLQVMPFYFIVGLIVSRLIRQQEHTEIKGTIFLFYWMIIFTFVFLV